jgi:hypothetical protein
MRIIKRYAFVFMGILSFLLGGQHLKAQNYASSLELSSGIVEDGYGINAGYNYYLNRFRYIQGAVFLSFAEDNQQGFSVPYNNFTLNIGYFNNIIEALNRKFTASLGAGPVVGYEIINNGEQELSTGALVNNSSEFIYGGFVGAELDLYLSESFSIIGKANQYYHPSSDLGQFAFFGGVGIRYILF